MKKLLQTLALLSLFVSARAFGGTFVLTADTSYDINSDHVKSVASFEYYRSMFEGTNYEYFAVQALTPFWQNWTAETGLDSWSNAAEVSVNANECYYTMLAVQRFDADTGALLENQATQSPGVCVPERCLVAVWEMWPGGYMWLVGAGYYPVGSPYQYTAQDTPTLVFVGWSGSVTSTSRTISGRLDSTSFTLIATYENAPDSGGTGGTGGGPIGPGDGGGPGTQLECIPGVDPGCGITSPIVINLDNGPYELTGTESPVLFDIAGTGTKLTIGWTAPGTNQAFLWMDRDHDGVVTGGAELFGTATVLMNGHRAPNGFEAFREFDANADGVIDAGDPVWPQLLLWTDRNHDGISQPSEITRLADSPVRSISLAYHWTGRRDEHGNTFRYEGITSLSTGGKGSREQPVYDIFFVLGISGRTIP